MTRTRFFTFVSGGGLALALALHGCGGSGDSKPASGGDGGGLGFGGSGGSTTGSGGSGAGQGGRGGSTTGSGGTTGQGGSGGSTTGQGGSGGSGTGGMGTAGTGGAMAMAGRGGTGGAAGGTGGTGGMTARDGGAVPAAQCMPGNRCTGDLSECTARCGVNRVYQCTCIRGEFRCGDCDTVDSGMPMSMDGGGRDYPNCPNGTNNGARCEDRGAICDIMTDAGTRRLCACGADRRYTCF